MRVGICIDIESTGYMSTHSVFKTPSGEIKDFEQADVTERVNGTFEKILDDSSEILSFGYIRADLDTNKIFDAGVLYFYKPYFHVESAAHIHGLTREFLQQHADKFDVNLAKMESLLLNSVIIGKNSASFDIPFIDTFLNKHRGVGALYPFINTLKMKTYDGKTMRLTNNVSSYDIQSAFAPVYRGLMAQVKNVELSKRTKGKLEEYVALLEEDNRFVSSVVEEAKPFCKDEFGEKFHDAFYDVCATWLVYKFCKEIGL